MGQVRDRGDRPRARSAAPIPARHPGAFSTFLLLVAIASLAYVNSLRNGFVFDDNLLISQAREIQALGDIPRLFDPGRTRSLPVDQQITHRPVRTLALALEHHIFGHNPAGYRVVNILLHALNGLLVFAILRALLNRPWSPMLAAVLFLVHPIQTESVAYIAGQRDVLFTVFYLFGFLSFVRCRETGRTGHLILAGLAYLLSLLTKEMAVTLPLLCVAYDALRSVPGRDPGITPPIGTALRTGLLVAFNRSKWLYLGMGGTLAVVLLYFTVVANPSHQRGLYGGGVGPTLMTSMRILAYYVKQMVFPLTLNADSYASFDVSRSIADPRGHLALLILSCLGFALFRLLRTDRWITFGGVWFFLTLLPVSQIIPHQELVAEHFLYLPSIGFCLVVSLIVERGLVSRRAAPATAAVFALVVVLLGARTIWRNRDWKDELSLWTKAVQASPQSYWAHQRLGDAYKSSGRYEEAIREYRIVQTLTPGYATEFIAIGDSHRRMGQYEEAADQLRQALAISPGSVAARLGLAQTYFAMGLLERAREEHQVVARYVSQSVQDFQATGDARLAAGLAAEAVQAYRNGLELNPFDAMLYLGLWKAHTILGQHEEAAAAYRQALQLDPATVAPKGQLDELTRAAAPAAVPPR